MDQGQSQHELFLVPLNDDDEEEEKKKGLAAAIAQKLKRQRQQDNTYFYDIMNVEDDADDAHRMSVSDTVNDAFDFARWGTSNSKAGRRDSAFTAQVY